MEVAQEEAWEEGGEAGAKGGSSTSVAINALEEVLGMSEAEIAQKLICCGWCSRHDRQPGGWVSPDQ